MHIRGGTVVASAEAEVAKADLPRETGLRAAASRLHPEDELDRSCQDASGLADAPSGEPRRSWPARRTVPAREARGHRTGASALRSDLMANHHNGGKKRRG